MEEDFTEQISEIEDFVPLFPLPNLVMFPGLVQPLHVFEPRYRQMAADALASNRLIALALLKPGYESDYESKNCPIHEMVCLGTMNNEEVLPDGRCNFLFQGLKRATVIEEVSSDKLYRMARLELKNSSSDESLNGQLENAKEELVAEIAKAIPSLAQSPSFPDEFMTQADVGLLCDLVSFSCAFEPEVAQTVLNELDVLKRYELVHEILRQRRSPENGDRDFPPEFSMN